MLVSQKDGRTSHLLAKIEPNGRGFSRIFVPIEGHRVLKLTLS